ncbi:phosphonate ABC transporter substrate-binding protein [Siculibacillus lacustris]|uniref:Phosphonate ABC transporter substrate-binding protein n=1 Tax=Siculibacillus lacustris TaxID=1549641 RepID=A0A4Q9VPB8_9HYPH|nr:phosphonate ABC transporter substrate-binding protein [Siculibacillus lacustris]TBW37586.1 phosphonate ABC transporter substrate-binding protein [Siculibacillus lacustris]
MIVRRSVLGLVAGAVALSASGAMAQDWKAKYPEIVFGKIPDENASGTTDRYGPFMDFLSKEIGTKVTLRIAQDYAAVIEGQRAGQIQIGYYGPASYARATMVGAKIEPVAIEVNEDGTKGYYSVFYVKKDSPYQKIEDLKGKNLGLVDPNSTSGNNVPRFSLNKMGIDPETFFSKVVYTGSHENAVIALGQGTVDVAANWWNDENESMLKRMERKGMAKYDDYRIIFKSEQIVNSPIAVMSDLPADLKKKIADAILAFPIKEPEAFKKMTDGKQRPWQPVTHDAYKPVVELNKFVDELRKKKS